MEIAGSINDRLVVSDKEIRQLLVELTKTRVVELLNLALDKNLDKHTFYAQGTSTDQINLVRRWINAIVLPMLREQLMNEMEETAKKIIEEEVVDRTSKKKNKKK